MVYQRGEKSRLKILIGIVAGFVLMYLPALFGCGMYGQGACRG